MPDIKSLIQVFEPIAPSTPCGVALDRFLDAPDCDLLVAIEAGRPVGVVVRGAVRAIEADRLVHDVMTRPLTVEADSEIELVCTLLLSHPEPVPGVVVVENSHYVGVVSTRNLLAYRRGDGDVAETQRFLDVISHEVRSPMNGVVAVAELLQRQPLSADSQAFVRTILESSKATLRALNDAMELSRAEFGDMALEPSPVFLRDVMDAVHASWQTSAARDGVTLLVAYDGEPDLNATLDAGRVRQVFDKLIEAAIASGGGEAVEASLRAVRTVDGLCLTGRVRGAGGQSAAHLVEAFGDETQGGRRASLGAGLGLALCKRIIRRMGGAIRADSNVGAGVTVAFEIEVAETVAAAAESFGEVQGGRGAAHILVVDDNATNRMVAEALCEMFDCTSECAEDGVEAVEAARSGRFDLILMDIRMPRMDGVEAARAIRAFPGSAGRVPIIALTANADPEDAKTYIESGMHSVVEKPIKPERLLQAINAALPDSADRAAAA